MNITNDTHGNHVASKIAHGPTIYSKAMSNFGPCAHVWPSGPCPYPWAMPLNCFPPPGHKPSSIRRPMLFGSQMHLATKQRGPANGPWLVLGRV